MKLGKCLTADKLCIGMKRSHERPAREISIHDNLKYVVMATVFVEIPIIIVGLVEEVEAVETFDPSDFDFDVEVFSIVVEAAAFARLFELVYADRVHFGNDGPMRRIAVNAWNLVGGKLKNLVFDAGPFERESGDGEGD